MSTTRHTITAEIEVPKIVTSHVFPPIPVRSFDWCAHYDDPEGPTGYGETEGKAITDLTENYPPEGHQSANPEIEITYSFLPGAGPTGPTYSSGGEPGYGPEVELISAKLITGDGLVPTQEQIDEWASEWLSNKGYERACEEAISDHENDRAEAADRAADDRAERLAEERMERA